MLKRWRPAQAKMGFPSAGAPILEWLGRLETWCASQPAGSDYLGLHTEFTWLRDAVNHELPGPYAPGQKVDDILRDLRALPHNRPEARPPGEQHREFPQDIVTQLYPSADVPRLPQDALVRIEGITHTPAQYAVRSNELHIGSHVIAAAPAGTKAHNQALPFVVSQVVDTSRDRNTLLVAWYVPQLARQVNFRGGPKKLIIDVFGPWLPADEMTPGELSACTLPDHFLPVQSVLEANFDFTVEQTLPYEVFDALRNRHQIDATGFSLSMTRHGNLYRQYCLMRGQ